MIAGTTMYSENLIGIKLNTPVRRVEKPFFIDLPFWICPNTSYTISTTMCSRTHSIMWNYWDKTDSLIVQLRDIANIVYKMYDMYKSFDFSELDNTSYFYGQLVKY